MNMLVNIPDEALEAGGKAAAGIKPDADWPTIPDLGGDDEGARDDALREAMRDVAVDVLEAAVPTLLAEIDRLTNLVAAVRRGRDNRERMRGVHISVAAADAWDEGFARGLRVSEYLEDGHEVASQNPHRMNVGQWLFSRAAPE